MRIKKISKLSMFNLSNGGFRCNGAVRKID